MPTDYCGWRIRLAPTLAIIPLAGCGEPGEVYSRPAAEVRTMLRSTEEPPVFGSVPLETRVLQKGDGTVVWTLVQANKPILRLIAAVTPVDPNSARVAVSVTGPTDNPDDTVTRKLEENPSIRDLYATAMAEQIDARMEGRTFDYSKIAAATSRAMVSNIGQIADQMDKAAEASSQRDAENVRKAYQREAQGGWGDADSADSEPAYGEPMDDTAGE